VIAGFIFSLIPSKERVIARLQLALFLPEKGGRELVPHVYMNLGQTLFEAFNLKPIVEKIDNYVMCSDSAALEKLINPETGVVALTAHTGNWDLLAAYLIAKGVPLCTIGKEMNRVSWQDLLEGIRSGYGIRTIWRTDRAGLREIVKELQERHVIGALIDQDTDVSSTFAPFS
jgi:KDO2-lipid IV(A) lauroyltransferase